MYAPRPIISMLSDPPPAEIISPGLVKEYIGHDPDTDAEQDNVLPVLIQAAIDQGQQITGIVWAAAAYRIDGICPAWPGAGFLLPLSPVFSVDEIVGKDSSGADVDVLPFAYSLIPSGIEFGFPWAELLPLDAWPEQAVFFSVTCTAGWTAETLPKSLRSWALVRIASMYDYRSDLVTGTISASLPRHHSNGLLDRWTVRGFPDG